MGNNCTKNYKKVEQSSSDDDSIVVMRAPQCNVKAATAAHAHAQYGRLVYPAGTLGSPSSLNRPAAGASNSPAASVSMSVKLDDDADEARELVRNGISADDVVQGELGDCWFLAACSAVAWVNPELIDHLMKKVSTGVDTFKYCVRFWTTIPGWQEVEVDDVVPFGQTFARSSQPSEMWPTIIEKAYAKLHGGKYEYIEGGDGCDALVNLTGGVGECISVKHPRHNPDELWTKFHAWNHDGYPMVASTAARRATDQDQGIFANHAYSVLRVEQFDGNRLVCVRNPHGMSEWTGKWSDTDTKSWTDAAKTALDYKDMEDDGVCWISWLDFCSHFDKIHVCKLLTAKKGWRLNFESQGRSECPCRVLLPTVSKPTDVVISLRQEEWRGTGQKAPATVRLDVEPNDPASIGTNAVFARAETKTTEVTLELTLDPSKDPCALVATVVSTSAAVRFKIRVFLRTQDTSGIIADAAAPPAKVDKAIAGPANS